MATEVIARSSRIFVRTVSARCRDYTALTKTRLVSLVMLSTFVGFFLASEGLISISLLSATLIGTYLVASGSMALNQWMERRLDAKMERTASRPIPSGRVQPTDAFWLGAGLSALGLGVLVLQVNLTACVIAAFILASYLLLYTPLKTRSSLCTIVGAVPGALPPLIGWAAAAGSPSYEAWVLFAIIFLWQMPHFLAIAWRYRDDFARAGFRMLSVDDTTGQAVGRQALLYALALLPVSLLPSVIGLTAGGLYFTVALLAGIGFSAAAGASWLAMDRRAKLLFHTSIFYLTLILIFMVMDQQG